MPSMKLLSKQVIVKTNDERQEAKTSEAEFAGKCGQPRGMPTGALAAPSIGCARFEVCLEHIAIMRTITKGPHRMFRRHNP